MIKYNTHNLYQDWKHKRYIKKTIISQKSDAGINNKSNSSDNKHDNKDKNNDYNNRQNNNNSNINGNSIATQVTVKTKTVCKEKTL